MRLLHPLFAVLLLVAFAGLACSRGAGSAAGTSAAARPSPSPTVSGTGVVAEVNGAPIFAAELDQKAAARLARVRQEEYEIRKQTLDALIAERLLDGEASRRGLSREDLLKREVAGKVHSVPETAIASIYEQNKPRFGNAPREQALARIREVMDQRSQTERRAAYEKELRDRSRVAVRLEPPRVPVTIPAGAPSTGPANAPVSIVEFTDYQCPFCHREQPVIDQVLAKYPGKVRLVHMDFPLDGHPGAFPAARAARCAGDQGKFWDFHRSLMTVSGSLDEADLKGRAEKLGLKTAEFGSCLASTRHDAEIKAGFEQGEALGVSGTPAYFINGRMLSGARPLEDFAEAVDTELAGS